MNHRILARSLTVAMVAAMCAPITTTLFAQAPLPGYSPLNTRYRIAISTQVSQVMNGQSMEASSSMDQLASVAIAKDGAAFTLTIVVDSVTATSSGGAPTPDVLGLKYSGVMNPDGHVVTSTMTDKAGNPVTTGAVSSFLPRLKIGATPGTTWADTTSTTRTQNGGPVTTVVVANYTLVGDTTVAGGKGWKLAFTSIGTVNGTGNQQGADYTIKGSTNGGGTLVVGAGGALVGADLVNDAKMTVDVPMAGMQIPVTQKQTTKVTRIP